MVTLIGVLGALIILTCFIGNELNKLDRDSVWYDVGNLVGSLLMMFYSLLIMSWPFRALTVVWDLGALRDLLKTLPKQRSHQTSKTSYSFRLSL